LMDLPLNVILFFSLTAFNILSLFSVLIVLTIICWGAVLFWSCLLASLSQDLGKFLLLFYWCINFSLDLFSFFTAHDSQVWSLIWVTKFLTVPFAALESST
jgi:hypothetical protein